MELRDSAAHTRRVRSALRIIGVGAALAAAFSALPGLRASSAAENRAAEHVIPCDVVFTGRIVDAWKPERGIVALTVVVGVIEHATPAVCAPSGTFVVRLPSTHPLAKEPAAVRKTLRRFRAIGHTGVKTETTDLQVVGDGQSQR